MSVSNQLPERLGRYRVLGRLARGGMAEILLGRLEGPSGFRRPVVLKRILPQFAHSSRFVDALRDEAHISAAISHANVVSVHELCEEDGEVFLVMEHLNGVSVRELMGRSSARARVTPRLAAWIVAEACAGLQAAHGSTDSRGTRLGVVHRDISLDNLFVTIDGDVKVLDFGIASAVRRQSYTLPGEIKGKVAYMAPEQMRGEQTTPRTDIFAMGVVLYEASTSQRLFRGQNSDEIQKAVLSGTFPDPRTQSADYPADLADVCMRALRVDPAERYATAAEMRAALLGTMRGDAAMGSPRDELGALVQSAFSDQIQKERERWTLLMTPPDDSVHATTRELDDLEAFQQQAPASAELTRPGMVRTEAPTDRNPAVPPRRDTQAATPIALREQSGSTSLPPRTAEPRRGLVIAGIVLALVATTVSIAFSRPKASVPEPAPQATPAPVVAPPVAPVEAPPVVPTQVAPVAPAVVDKDVDPSKLAPVPMKHARKKHKDDDFPSFD